ncbi:MAG: hypothetical protein UFX20_13330 [Longibaculum muris]|uniref:Uncharacterized protein n=1 Tax=Longibaculum muris TaxID=1796628 RepID=A0A4R3Z5B6_9FIRM|nr:hypothetical protein [Longibaculum muris]KXU45389.1 hypothetical protein HMPREF3037_02265 [Candidatus Stoquefichus sp. KLE1796]MBS5369506.1 hypothetical protein [Coprobacillus cateniformis]MCR1886598.1 hypothetical protein [Longibaculum muris]MED9813073.1 hypothetical protein [Longibaculum muris]TCW01650.1 hypothetical protein EDD60_103106 [Longibaculum muris]
MFLVNFVYDDEELLEPYEWQDDDCFEEFYYLPIYYVSLEQLHDFIYAQLCIDDLEDSIFIVCDGHYSVVIEMRDGHIYRRGTVNLLQRDVINDITKTLGMTYFEYRIIEEAYEKEFGLTRDERLKKICLEEVIDEIFVVHYELFLEICEQLNIKEEGPSEKYLALKHKIEKGYSSLHELLYQELVQKG